MAQIPGKKDEKDLGKFLDKVDELEAVLKGMNSGDAEASEKCMKKADEMIEEFEMKQKDKQDREDSIARTVSNRTVINKDAYKNDDEGQSMDQSGFLAALEEDAKARAEKKKIATREGHELKLKGNEAYKQGDLEKAVEFYTEGLTKIKDLLPLWTNRAMVLNKLGRHEEALNDCDWAFKVQEKCSKAYLQQGKAHFAMGDFDAAKKSYSMILECDQSLKKQVEGYIHEVELVEQNKNESEEAKRLFEEGNIQAQNMNEILKKIMTPQPRVEYYLGGLQLLVGFIRNEQDRVLFRTNNGFSLHMFDMIYRSQNRLVAKCKKTDIEICIALMKVYELACVHNEQNQRILFQDSEFLNQIWVVLESKEEKLKLVQSAIFQFLKTICKDEFGMVLTIGSDTQRLVKVIFSHCSRKDSLTECLDLLCAITKESKFNTSCRSVANDVVVPLFVAMETLDNERKKLILTSLINMTSDSTLRRHLNDNATCWRISIALLKKCKNVDVLKSLFVFLINLSTEKSETAGKFAEEVILATNSDIFKQDASLQKGNLGLYSHLLPKYDSAKAKCTPDLLDLCLKFCSDDDMETVKYSCRILACLSKDEKFSSRILDNNGMKILVSLVKLQNDDVVANVVLCLTDLIELDEAKAKIKVLKDVDIVKDLLVRVRDTLNETMKKNGAILLAKLAKLDQEFLDRLRELHGVEILLQNVKAESL